MVERITNFGSPEKWAIHNKQIAQANALRDEVKHSFSLLALRVLVDAFLYKLGYRGVEWTKEETVQWEQKKQAAGLTRSQTIVKSTGHLTQFGFNESELSALFSASIRTEMNAATHSMKINAMVMSLNCLDGTETSRSAVKKAFEYVCGVKMEDVDTMSQDIITSTGIQSGPGRDKWLFEEEIGTWY